MASDLFPDTILIRPDILSRLDFAALFGNTAPVELELGAGDGSFLLQYSAAHPEVIFLGVERLFGRLRKIDRKGRRQGLKNLRGLRMEATYLMDWMIAPASLSAIHVYFPDPWPKKRHHKRRIVQTGFVELLAQKMAAGGIVHMATDWENYAGHMLEVLQANPDFENLSESGDYCVRPAWRPLTKYEKRGQKLGHGVYDLLFLRRS